MYGVEAYEAYPCAAVDTQEHTRVPGILEQTFRQSHNASTI
jgi:hypothetical protein